MEPPTNEDGAAFAELAWKPLLHVAAWTSRLRRTDLRRLISGRKRSTPFWCECKEAGLSFVLCGIESECLCDFHCREKAELLAADRDQDRAEESEYDWYLDEAARLKDN